MDNKFHADDGVTELEVFVDKEASNDHGSVAIGVRVACFVQDAPAGERDWVLLWGDEITGLRDYLDAMIRGPIE